MAVNRSLSKEKIVFSQAAEYSRGIIGKPTEDPGGFGTPRL